MHVSDWHVRGGQSPSWQQGSTPVGQSLLSMAPLQSRVRQKRVAALVTSPRHAEEPRFALVRLAPRRLALVNRVFLIAEPERS